MLFLAPRAPRWAPILRTGSIRDLQTLAQKNCVTNESARKHATIALKG